MIDLEKWYRRCLIQLQIPTESGDSLTATDAICCFAEDPEWLKYCVLVADTLNLVPKTKQIVELLPPKQAEKVNQTYADKGFPITLPNGVTIDQHGTGFIKIKELELPPLPLGAPKIFQGQPLPNWFINFYQSEGVAELFTIDKYLSFKEIGDLGWIIESQTPEMILDDLIQNYDFTLGDQQNSENRRALCLIALEYFLANKTLGRVPRSIYAHLSIAEGTGSNTIKDLRKALRVRELELTPQNF